ncbi:hypothetical protein MNBD_IGNAVI01-697 [hydrothermal vent metagenome]|uniref:Uncharacterized protein n=1 Tax=hydrothermal vent metagenome TaxID=652676 RepID=A0A3B1CG09_9ZZZZ
MKILIKIVAVLAALMGLMALVTGSRVLLGLFDPGYQYFTALLVYNVTLGVVSILAGYFIWKKENVALYFSYFITGAHIIVFLLLITVFNDIIAYQSINAMTFRSVAWIIFTFIIWKRNSNLEKKRTAEE